MTLFYAGAASLCVIPHETGRLSCPGAALAQKVMSTTAEPLKTGVSNPFNIAA